MGHFLVDSACKLVMGSESVSQNNFRTWQISRFNEHCNWVKELGAGHEGYHGALPLFCNFQFHNDRIVPQDVYAFLDQVNTRVPIFCIVEHALRVLLRPGKNEH